MERIARPKLHCKLVALMLVFLVIFGCLPVFGAAVDGNIDSMQVIAVDVSAESYQGEYYNLNDDYIHLKKMNVIYELSGTTDKPIWLWGSNTPTDEMFFIRLNNATVGGGIVNVNSPVGMVIEVPDGTNNNFGLIRATNLTVYGSGSLVCSGMSVFPLRNSYMENALLITDTKITLNNGSIDSSSWNGTVVLAGTADVKITGNDRYAPLVIGQQSTSTLTLKDSAKLSVFQQDKDTPYEYTVDGIEIFGNLILEDSSYLEAHGKNCSGIYQGNGISCNGSVTVGDNAEVVAKGYGIGLWGNTAVTINGGKVTVEGKTSNGIYTEGSISVSSNAEIDASGYYPALYSAGDTILKNCRVNAISTEDCGIWANDNLVISEDCEVTATGVNMALGAANDIKLLPLSDSAYIIMGGSDEISAEELGISPISAETVLTNDDVENYKYLKIVKEGSNLPPVGNLITYYQVVVEETDNGKVTTDCAAASSGASVMITVNPEEGYKLDKLTVTDKNGGDIEIFEKGGSVYQFTMPFGQVTVKATFIRESCDGGEYCLSKKFEDVNLGSWYHESLDFVVENNFMNGISETKFAPHDITTRGMITTILYRMEGEPEISGICPYEDAEVNSYYEDALIWAAENNIVNGYEEGRFGPEDPVTREQMAAIFYRYAVYKGYDISTGDDTNILSYADALDISEYAAVAMQWACVNGIIQGRDDGTLAPRDSAERCEVAAILQRFCLFAKD